jgi:hypothetical protein
MAWAKLQPTAKAAKSQHGLSDNDASSLQGLSLQRQASIDTNCLEFGDGVDVVIPLQSLRCDEERAAKGSDALGLVAATPSKMLMNVMLNKTSHHSDYNACLQEFNATLAVEVCIDTRLRTH